MPPCDSAAVQRMRLGYTFGLYRNCLAQRDELARQTLDEWSTRVKQEGQQYNDDDREAIYEFYSEEHLDRVYSTDILMNSFFVGTYALYEDLRNRLIDKFSIGKKNFECSQLVKSREWGEIERYKQIRDRIMHHGGVIQPCGEATDYAQDRAIKFDALPDRYGLARTFCDEALSKFEQCLLNAVTEFAGRNGLLVRHATRPPIKEHIVDEKTRSAPRHKAGARYASDGRRPGLASPLIASPLLSTR